MFYWQPLFCVTYFFSFVKTDDQQKNGAETALVNAHHWLCRRSQIPKIAVQSEKCNVLLGSHPVFKTLVTSIVIIIFTLSSIITAPISPCHDCCSLFVTRALWSPKATKSRKVTMNYACPVQGHNEPSFLAKGETKNIRLIAVRAPNTVGSSS